MGSWLWPMETAVVDDLPAAVEGPTLSDQQVECILEQAVETSANNIALPTNPGIQQSSVQCDPLVMLQNYMIARNAVGWH